ncbi:uncharacterized protein [Pithys albifrons albifrons]|uniref:uncharacterized protein n=1 Tax=Pithys albifrons albifrons TaxID=3385563 RepID=UPI003A5CFDD4
MEGTITIRLLQTTTFQNSSFVDTEGLGLLEDIELGSLDKHTLSIHFYQPWVRPALPHGDWETIENMIKIYLHQFSHLINEGAMQRYVPYPFVAQCVAGCKLYPNRTSHSFISVAYNGQDFLSFNTDNATWTLCQDTNLSRYVQAVLQNYTAFSELVEILFNDTCVDDMEELLRSGGRAALERQEVPVATVFARTPSPHQLLLVCHVTAFYPRPISVAWLRDGQEVPPGPALNTSTVLPNADLTYQLRSVLAVAPRDGHSYACRVRHRSLGTRSLLIPWGNSQVLLLTGLVAALLAAVAMAAMLLLWLWRRGTMSTIKAAKAEPACVISSFISHSLFFLLLNPPLHPLGLTAGTMQPAHCCLLLLYFFLISGIWATMEGTFTLRVIQITTFQNSSSVDTEGLGLLEDITLGSLDKQNMSIHFYQPWVQPALHHSEWETIENIIKNHFKQFSQLFNEGAVHTKESYPFVAQAMAGCELYPNRTSRFFASVAYNGQDFLRFDTDNATWTLSQNTSLSRYILAILRNYTDFSQMVEIIFNDICVDHLGLLLHSGGRASVERQEVPVATVFARTPSPHQLLLVCHVTAFYPRPISVAWLRDGQEVPPGPALNTSTVLPNADLTYQLRSVLAVAPRDGHSYACRVRHRSLGTRSLLIPWGNSQVLLLTGLVAALLAAVAVAATLLLWLWRCRKHQCMEESETTISIQCREI